MPTVMPAPKPQFDSIAGLPMIGGKIYTFAAGATTPKPTYSDAAGTIEQPNPIPLNARGEPEKPIFWRGNYRVELRDVLGNLVYTVDNFEAPVMANDISGGAGSGVIGFDYDLVYLPRSIGKWLQDLSKSTGSSFIGYTSPIPGSPVRKLDSKLRESISVFDRMTPALIADALSGTPVLDHTAAVQAAITYCIGANLDLEVPGLCRITAPLMIDRQVDSLAYDSYFTMHTSSGGGFFVDSAINIFSSTIVDPVAAVTQLIRWENLRFVASSNALEAYVLHGIKFLRSEFVGCNFSKIKALFSDRYVQSVYFFNCNGRRWSGTFFKCGPQGYDIQVIGGLYEAGSGDCFDVKAPIGCKFWTQIEGMSGTALKINAAQGVDISCYFEANGLDIDSRTGGLTSQGINVHGCVIARSDTVYSILWGTCYGCVSQGNWHTGYAHDLQADSLVEINDYAQYSLSNSGDVKAHGGYREGPTAALVVRGSTSDAYTVSGLISNFTRIGYRNVVEFTCTMTSTGTNPQDTLFIPGLFPANAAHGGAICGSVEVAGSTINNGISPLYISLALPMRVASSLAVIPANVAGAAYTVRGQVSWQGAS